MTPLADSFFATANCIEAALWAVIGAGFIVHALRPRAANRIVAFVAAITFLAFGLSDVVETRTGAWWRPWWLVAWKGVCVVVFLALLCRYILNRNTAPPSSATSSDRPA
jgi:hypothetical protein